MEQSYKNQPSAMVSSKKLVLWILADDIYNKYTHINTYNR